MKENKSDTDYCNDYAKRWKKDSQEEIIRRIMEEDIPRSIWQEI